LVFDRVRLLLADLGGEQIADDGNMLALDGIEFPVWAEWTTS
jgi:hypothetical protein